MFCAGAALLLRSPGSTVECKHTAGPGGGHGGKQKYNEKVFC